MLEGWWGGLAAGLMVGLMVGLFGAVLCVALPPGRFDRWLSNVAGENRWLRSWVPWPRARRIVSTSTLYRRGDVIVQRRLDLGADRFVVTRQSKWPDVFGGRIVYGRKLSG
jgi:hypothetical protein